LNNQLRNKFALILVGNIILVGLITAGVQGLPNPLAIIRLILGLIYVLFMPGYMLQLVLFPGKVDLDNIERLALSFALSGVIVPPIVLLLNWLPWGITLWPIVISLSIFILVCMIIAIVQRLRLSTEERNEPKVKFNLLTWWAEQERANRIVYIILTMVLATAFLTAFSILVTPKPSEYFTEFYILGQEGLAEDYPREITAGDSVAITTGITNREGVTSTYHIQVKLGDQVIGQDGPLTLENNSTWEQPVEFSIPIVGDDQQAMFILDREGQPSPYRTLRLWIKVTPAETP
jgi:uncharacterized membrane protein